MSHGVTILLGSLLMSLVALVGAFTLVLPARRLQQVLAPLVSLAAGSLLGGALFHMLPEGFAALAPMTASAWISIGFTAFLALEIFLHWHHSHRNHAVPVGASARSQPLPLLILIGDGLHNFVGGFGIASAYLIHPEAGVAAWIAAVAHEVPQELGDFGVLLHSGWSPRRALVWNFVSALTFPLGALLAWRFQQLLPLSQMVLFAAGNFLYIAASDLVPEIKAQVSLQQALSRFGWFISGLVLLRILASA
ncbi:MAG: ZIP family metal transporter [Synechococcaceae bacterium WB9_4xB_025]|jgi:zinc and cadmium transporter|nr:ZIP family metal transporter [Synechococcaceae bacterium WB9_4xB_025]